MLSFIIEEDHLHIRSVFLVIQFLFNIVFIVKVLIIMQHCRFSSIRSSVQNS